MVFVICDAKKEKKSEGTSAHIGERTRNGQDVLSCGSNLLEVKQRAVRNGSSESMIP